MHNTLLKQFLGSFSDNPKSKTCPESYRGIQNLKWGGIVAIAVTFTMCGAVAQAQQQGKIPKIGWLSPSSAASTTRIDLILPELRKLGYLEGKNIVIESRYADR